MPNDCINSVRIGATEQTIKLLADTEFSFEKLCPGPSGDRTDWNYEHWGTKWDRYDYRLEKRGDQGIILHFTTAWAPPTEFFKYLIETHKDIWLRCDWSEEGGGAGMFIGKWDKEENFCLDIQEFSWEDWCLEEWQYRMSNDDDYLYFSKPLSHCKDLEEHNNIDNCMAVKVKRGELREMEKAVKRELMKKNQENEPEFGEIRTLVIERLADKLWERVNPVISGSINTEVG